MTEDVNKRVAQFIGVRDKLKALDEAHEAKRKPLVELRDKLTGILREFMEASGSEGIKTEAGTCYLSTRYTASLADSAAFMKFVVDNGKFDLLDKKANATAVRDYVAETGNLPPGVNLTGNQTIGVRRKTGEA